MSSSPSDLQDPKPPPIPPSRDAEEQLAKFREEWKAEVRRRLGQAAGPEASATGITQPTSETETRSEALSSDAAAKGKEREPAVRVTRIYDEFAGYKPTPKRPGENEIVKVELLPYQKTALEIYQQAVAHEQKGEIEEALVLYRRAFRGYDNVDRLYTHLEKLRHKQETAAAGGSTSTSNAGHARIKSKDSVVDQLTRDMSKVDVAGKPAHDTSASLAGSLSSMVAQWGEHLTFMPEEGRERQPVPISKVPDEMLVHIIALLDLASLERFATVNRKARVLTMDSSVWRTYVQELYKPPQIPPEEDVPSLLTEYRLDYRRMFIEHPRVRLDGVYIAVLHYTRQGLSENAWVNVTHLITYHRYLRFYADGTVLSLLANEEIGPKQVVHILKPSLRMKGFYIGTWRLVGTDVVISDLTDPTLDSTPGSDPPKYRFQMRLELKSRPLGRWNRLNLMNYDSVSADGEATPLLVKHDRPFWFSKVKSYGRL